MEDSRTHRAMVIAAVSGAALASSLVIAAPAHADAVIWNCTSASALNSSGVGTGTHCTHTSLGTSYGGPGLLEVKGVPKYQCTSFSYFPDDSPGFFYVFANACQ